MALLPQPSVPPSSQPPGGPARVTGFWIGVAAAVLAIASIVAAICREIAARWRGIVVAHLFFLTLWMAMQVFFFATGAYWCLPGDSSRFVRLLTASFAHVARCGPPVASPLFHGVAAAAAHDTSAPAPTPPPAPLAAMAPAAPRAPSFGLAFGAPAPAAAPKASGAASGWSARTITNCWRNRAVSSGDCYETANPRRTPPPPPPRYRYRYRYPESYAYERPPRPCLRHYDCWPDNYWRDDDL